MGLAAGKLFVVAGASLMFGVSSILFAKAFKTIAEAVKPAPKNDSKK